MDWLSLPVNVLVTVEHMKIPKPVRATWLVLLGQCALRESGGCLRGAAEWSFRDWDRVANTTRHEVEKLVEHGLGHWENTDLIVHHYPQKNEDTLRAKRDGGAEGGRQSAEKRAQQRKSQRSAPSTPSNHNDEGEVRTSATNGEERRGEERRGEEGSGAENALSFALTHPEPPAPSPVTLLRNAWLAWFSERYADDYAWRSRDADDASELVKLAGGRGVDEVMRRARILGAQRREKAITPAIVRMAWNEVAARPAPPASDPLLDGMAAGTIR